MEKKTIGEFAITDELSVKLSYTGRLEAWAYELNLIYNRHELEVVLFERYGDRGSATERFLKLVEILTKGNREE